MIRRRGDPVRNLRRTPNPWHSPEAAGRIPPSARPLSHAEIQEQIASRSAEFRARNALETLNEGTLSDQEWAEAERNLCELIRIGIDWTENPLP